MYGTSQQAISIGELKEFEKMSNLEILELKVNPDTHFVDAGLNLAEFA